MGWSRYPKPGFLVSGFNLIFNFGAKGWKIIIYGKRLAKYKELTTILNSIAFPTQTKTIPGSTRFVTNLDNKTKEELFDKVPLW